MPVERGAIFDSTNETGGQAERGRRFGYWVLGIGGAAEFKIANPIFKIGAAPAPPLGPWNPGILES